MSYNAESLPIRLEYTPVRSGYEFAGWHAVNTDTGASVSLSGGVRIRLGTTGNLTIIGAWRPAAAEYKVEHYQQYVDGDGYALYRTDMAEGMTGELTQAVSYDYVGFTAQPFAQKTIEADGSTVVQIYYDRNYYNVSYYYSGEKTDGAPPVPATVSYKFGKSVVVENVPSLPGYDFEGWTTVDAEVENGRFIMPDHSVIFDGRWIRLAVPYTVEHWLQNINDDYTLSELTTDPALQIDNEHRFVMPDEDVKINGNCTTNSYTITFDVTVGDHPVDPMTYTIVSNEALPGADSALNRFEGWKVTVADGNWALNAVYNADTALTGKYGNVTLTAQWSEKVSYIVDEYKYAPQGWYMLRIMDNLAPEQSYAFGDSPSGKQRVKSSAT